MPRAMVAMPAMPWCHLRSILKPMAAIPLDLKRYVPPRERRERRHSDALSIHLARKALEHLFRLEEAPQGLAGVGAPEPGSTFGL